MFIYWFIGWRMLSNNKKEEKKNTQIYDRFNCLIIVVVLFFSWEHMIARYWILFLSKCSSPPQMFSSYFFPIIFLIHILHHTSTVEWNGQLIFCICENFQYIFASVFLFCIFEMMIWWTWNFLHVHWTNRHLIWFYTLSTAHYYVTNGNIENKNSSNCFSIWRNERMEKNNHVIIFNGIK